MKPAPPTAKTFTFSRVNVFLFQKRGIRNHALLVGLCPNPRPTQNNKQQGIQRNESLEAPVEVNKRKPKDTPEFPGFRDVNQSDTANKHCKSRG